MKNEKRKFTAEFKVQVLRENLENQVRFLKYASSIISTQINSICGRKNYLPEH